MINSILCNIEQHPLFANVPREHTLKYLTDASVNITDFKANEVAYSSKSEKHKVAFILSGSAKVYTGDNDESALMRTLNVGDTFGIANLYAEDELFPSNIITSEDTKILFINGDSFKEYVENNNFATKNYLAFLSEKVVYLNKKLTTLTAGSAEKKLACYILEHNKGGILATQSLCELADILHMGRASLYRAIDCFVENKIIEKKGKRILILDIEKLKNI